MIKYLRLEVDFEDALDQGVSGVGPTVASSKLPEIFEAEDRAVLSVLCFSDGGVEIVVEGINKTLSSRGARCLEARPEPG